MSDMTPSALSQPYSLSEEVLERLVIAREPGVFALGFVDRSGRFVMQFVGRSDSNLRIELHKWVGRFPMFEYVCCVTAATAFILECELYHLCIGCSNQAHPAIPIGLKVLCPLCGFSTVSRGPTQSNAAHRESP